MSKAILLTPDQGTTWGSLTIQIGGMQLRQAAATARQALLAEAAKKLGAGRHSPSPRRRRRWRQKGSAMPTDRRQELLDQARPEAPVNKDPKDYKVVGKPSRVSIFRTR